MGDARHLFPTVTDTNSVANSFGSQRCSDDQTEDAIENSSLETFPTVPASELENESALDDGTTTRSSSSNSSHGVAYITEYPSLDMASTSAVLYYCKKRFLRPYFILLAILGWRSFSDSASCRFLKWLNRFYVVFLLSLILLGFTLQYGACFRMDGELPSEPLTILWNQTSVKHVNVSTKIELFAPGTSSRIGGWKLHKTDDFPPDPTDEQCPKPSLAAFILPDILLLGAYLFFFYVMRIAENEQMETLLEKAFLQSSCPVSLSNQRDMLHSLRIWLAAGILWLMAASTALLLYLATAEVRFNVISYTLLPWVHNSLESLLIIATWLQDVVQITLITSYCLQAQLLRLSLQAIATQVLQRQISLESAMKEIGESEKYLDYLNKDLGISICLLLVVNVSRFASGSLWFLLSDISLIPGVVLAASIMMVILWGCLFLLPLLQACRLSASYDDMRKLGHKVRERPFGFQNASPAELDSFLLYTSSQNLKARVVCLPVTAGYVCFGLGFLVFIALTMLQSYSKFCSSDNINLEKGEILKAFKMGKTFVFEVAMTCDGCVNAAKRVLGKVEDKIESYDVDLSKKLVTVITSQMSKDDVEEVLKKTGNDVKFVSETKVTSIARPLFGRWDRRMSSLTDIVMMQEINNKGLVTLNRPKALNALNLSMIRVLTPKLQRWRNEVDLIIMKGAGDKAFCAGGDVRAITEAGMKGSFMAHEFFREEYILDYTTGTMKIPYIALIDGIVMGGGFGVSVHGPYRVATENTLFAMPETAIGLFPDVGGTHFLPRMRGELGTFLALTGHRLRGSDVLHAGIATHICPRDRLRDLEAEILDLKLVDEASLETILQKFSLEYESNQGITEFSLAPHLELIEKVFSANSMEEIVRRLEADGSEWSLNVLKNMLKMSPTSLKVTLRQMRKGKKLDLKQSLELEYIMGQHFCADHDFYEGVRAVLIDKDNAPKWKPATLAEVSDEKVESFFKSIDPEDVLVLKDDPSHL
ncbi:unnamed protein product [Notodromas monacha]|uniref:3-hydroxyisobutyryl-CoA hydrolase, mitochondrial n=1 Tax=Notodromas monacha TaxID=399045 RepID=A0A7R9GC88_9CRUS|nr:unnamed protein product [Notodromas monacha]CAG0915732.1 unnamed protein product [Notodromas monacha]